jgi:putative nucleotidyltransferase with HDIG domain
MKRDIQAFLQNAGKLPSLPVIYQELVNAVESPNSSVEIISGIIQRDQSLASRLLKLANSAFYAVPFEIGTIEEAVQIIGLREIKDLSLATCVIRAFEKMPEDLVNVRSFWQHSIACGIASALLAEERHDPVPERFFVGGLLHDIGRLVMYLKAPQESRQILDECQKTGALAAAVEFEVLGFDHTSLGAELLQHWRLPAPLREMVACHHDPRHSHLAMVDVFIVHYADFLVTALEFGSSGEMAVAPLKLPADSLLCLPEDHQLEPILEELEIQCNQVFPILAGPA